MRELKIDDSFEQQNIKENKITKKQLEEMKQLAGSYEALFSRKAMLFRSMGLHEKQLTENDYKKLILEQYTFLKRPVILINNQIFIGNTKATIEKAREAIQ